MKNFRLLSFSLWAIAVSFALVSCQPEDTDTEVVTPDPVDTDTTDNNTCSGLLSFNNGPVTVSPTASATIFEPTCSSDPLWPDSSFYYYIIADDAFNWGTDGPVLTISGSGIPGVEFYSPNPLQVNTIYQPIGNIGNAFETYFLYQGGGMVTALLTQDIGITISEAGDEVGENIAGTITGYMANPSNPAGALEYFEAEFCVPIATVCN